MKMYICLQLTVLQYIHVYKSLSIIRVITAHIMEVYFVCVYLALSLLYWEHYKTADEECKAK